MSIENFPGNSRRSATPPGNKDEPPVEEKKLEKVVTGKVVHRKKPLGRRLREMFFSADSSSVFGYLLKEVIVPAIQATATDVVSQGIEKAVYGEVRSPRRSTFGRGSGIPRTHVSYDRPSTIVRPSSSSGPMRRPMSQPSAMDIGEIILDSQINAQVVADELYKNLEEYNAVTVADLNILLGETPAYTDHKYGWTDLQGLDIKRVREGWRLILPDPEDLR